MRNDILRRSLRWLMRLAGVAVVLLLVALAYLWWAWTALPGASDSPVDTAVEAAEHTTAIERSREMLTGLLDRYPALTVAVAVDGRLVWSEAIGFADVGDRRPATTATRMRIYSVAKPLTATAALRLDAAGALDVDAPVRVHLPDLPAALGDLTVRQLAGHLSGIRDYAEGEISEIGASHCETAREALTFFVDREPLASAPGGRYSYSSYNYVMLSAVLAAAASRSFESVLHDQVLAPAGMAHTTIDDPTRDRPDAATFYIPQRLGGWYLSAAPADWDNTCRTGAGGYLSTAEDLARFGVALLDGTLLAPEDVETMLTPMVTADGSPTGYGFGWGLSEDDGTRFAVHSGSGMGARSALVIVPERRVVVALLTNVVHDPVADEAMAIARAFAWPGTAAGS